jgi:N-acetylmuramoyl-L-alanine amidase
VLAVLKAVAGLVVLFLLLYTVSNWWQEYRSEAAKPRSSAGSAVGEGGGQASESPAAASAGATVVVLVDGLNLREEPDGDAKTIQGLDKDEKVVLVKQEGKWYEVKTAKGKTGWISASPSYSRVENP